MRDHARETVLKQADKIGMNSHVSLLSHKITAGTVRNALNMGMDSFPVVVRVTTYFESQYLIDGRLHCFRKTQ